MSFVIDTFAGRAVLFAAFIGALHLAKYLGA